MNNVLVSKPWENQIQKVGRKPIFRREVVKWGPLCLFAAAHIPLGLLIYQVRPIAVVHALTTLAVGLWWAVSGSRHLSRVAYTAAYIAGAEVLWRMTNTPIFWEFGKYSTAAIFLVAMFRTNRFKGGFGPVCYFLLLLPSAALTIQLVGWDKARDAFSFNLTGPFALMVCGWFFSNLKLSIHELQKLFLFFAAPVLGIAGIARHLMQQTEFIRFTSNASNFATSGGYGPNQVSSILGLGALMFFLFIVTGKSVWWLRVFAIVAMLFLASQSALTFSRGGLYNVIGAIGLASIYFVRDSRMRAKLLPLILIVTAAIYFLILPNLDSLTGGALSARFQNTDTTNRADIAAAQLEAWKDNPILGVGPGQTRSVAGQIAHTEVTRLPAEHGIFGLMALLSLLIMAIRNIRRARTPTNKALALGLSSWSFLFMLNTGMRLVAPSFVFGLSFVYLMLEDRRGSFDKDERRRSANRSEPSVFPGERRAERVGVCKPDRTIPHSPEAKQTDKPVFS